MTETYPQAELTGKKVVLGVSGGIAAYKSVLLLRLLKKAQADVRVVMTANAARFVGAVTFEALSEHPVYCHMFDPMKGGDAGTIRHIDWAQSADTVIIAPATANFLGKMAGGIADDALSTFVLATKCPLLVGPAMNPQMFQSPAVQRNLSILEKDGVVVIPPAVGQMACGTTGPGRLPEAEILYEYAVAALLPQDFAAKKVIVTAGPTREPFDPVRYISNPSTGKMGFAIARAAALRGADVLLVAGPGSQETPLKLRRINVKTAREMAEAVFAEYENADLVIKTAAVSDYRPEDCKVHKIKKEQGTLVITLERNTDILKTLGTRKKQQILVGFAAETQNLETYAKSKMAAKNLDMIVANLVNEPGRGFVSDTNAASLFFRDRPAETLPKMSKQLMAHVILDRVRWLLRKR